MDSTLQNPLINTAYFKGKIADKHLSIRKVAALMNLHPSTVSLMLRGYRNVKHAEQMQLASILGVSYADIVENMGIPAQAMPVHMSALFSACYRTFNAFQVAGLSIDQVVALGDLARALKDADPQGMMRPHKATK